MLGFQAAATSEMWGSGEDTNSWSPRPGNTLSDEMTAPSSQGGSACHPRRTASYSPVGGTTTLAMP